LSQFNTIYGLFSAFGKSNLRSLFDLTRCISVVIPPPLVITYPFVLYISYLLGITRIAYRSARIRNFGEFWNNFNCSICLFKFSPPLNVIPNLINTPSLPLLSIPVVNPPSYPLLVFEISHNSNYNISTTLQLNHNINPRITQYTTTHRTLIYP